MRQFGKRVLVVLAAGISLDAVGAAPSATAAIPAPDPVEYSTKWWNDYGALKYTFTDNRAALVLSAHKMAYIRIDTDRNTYFWNEIWYDTGSEHPAYIMVTGKISTDGWSQAFSGKYTQRVRKNSFRTAPNFTIPRVGEYTIDYTFHQNGAYWQDEKSNIKESHSGQVTIP